MLIRFFTLLLILQLNVVQAFAYGDMRFAGAKLIFHQIENLHNAQTDDVGVAARVLRVIKRSSKGFDFDAPKEVLPSNYRSLPQGWIRGPRGGKAWDTGYQVGGKTVYQRQSGGYYTIGENGSQIRVGSPKPHGNTLDNTPTEIYRRVARLDGEYKKIVISTDAHRRYTRKELGYDDIHVVKTLPRDQAAKLERFIAERWPGPQNRESWAGKRNPSHPNYDPNYFPHHMQGNN